MLAQYVARRAKSPCSGFPTAGNRHQLAIEVIFNMLTIRGIYGREMYETWYKMTVLLQSGHRISQPVITHRFSYKRFLRRASR